MRLRHFGDAGGLSGQPPIPDLMSYCCDRPPNVSDGSWLCKNVATRDDDIINVLPNRV